MSSESTSRPVSVADVRAIIRPRSPPSGPNDSTWRTWRLDESYRHTVRRKATRSTAVRYLERTMQMASTTEQERVQRARQHHDDGNEMGEKMVWDPATQTIRTVGPGGSGGNQLGYDIDKLGFSGREGSRVA